MKRVLLHIPVLLLLSPLCPIIAADEATLEVPGDGLVKALAPHPRPVIPIPTEGRRLALEAAGAFCNDGFRIRDGEWSSSLTKEAPVFLQLTLFAGNRYWFVAATPSAACSLRVTLYDAAGRIIKSEQWQDPGESSGPHTGARAAAGVAPGQSGQYFVSVELLESPSPAPVEATLVTAYK
jgi:hypothetical protein